MDPQANELAFLQLIQWAEGTSKAPDPYRVCYGYKHTIVDLRDHPAITGEWKGERLPDQMCINAGLNPGCVSTAAGAYQIIKPTWVRLHLRMYLEDFSPANQDAAALLLITDRGALADVHAGRIDDAVRKCSAEWASLPGSLVKQPQRKQDELMAVFERNGGALA